MFAVLSAECFGAAAKLLPHGLEQAHRDVKFRKKAIARLGVSGYFRVSFFRQQQTMAHHQSAIKRIRQSKKRNLYNRAVKKTVREATKAVRRAQDLASAEVSLRDAAKALDRAAAKGVLHKNTAANRKSALALFVNKLGRGEVKPVQLHHK